MVGRIDEQLRDQFEDLLLAAVDGDSERMAETIVVLGPEQATPGGCGLWRKLAQGLPADERGSSLIGRDFH